MKSKIHIKTHYRIKAPCYTCRCGRKVYPVTNPSRCPYCGQVTFLK